LARGRIQVQAPLYVPISPRMRLSVIPMLFLALLPFVFLAFAAPAPSETDTMNTTSAEIAAAEMQALLVTTPSSSSELAPYKPPLCSRRITK
jgi:hypothetical protein